MTAPLTREAQLRWAAWIRRTPALLAGAPSVRAPRPPRAQDPVSLAGRQASRGRSAKETWAKAGGPETRLQGQKCVCGKLQLRASAEGARGVGGTTERAAREPPASVPPIPPRQSIPTLGAQAARPAAGSPALTPRLEPSRTRLCAVLRAVWRRSSPEAEVYVQIILRSRSTSVHPRPFGPWRHPPQQSLGSLAPTVGEIDYSVSLER